VIAEGITHELRGRICLPDCRRATFLHPVARPAGSDFEQPLFWISAYARDWTQLNGYRFKFPIDIRTAEAALLRGSPVYRVGKDDHMEPGGNVLRVV